MTAGVGYLPGFGQNFGQPDEVSFTSVAKAWRCLTAAVNNSLVRASEVFSKDRRIRESSGAISKELVPDEKGRKTTASLRPH